MFFYPARTAARWLAALALLVLGAGRLPAASTGPTLQFDYGASQPERNPLGFFMYFVPLISPEEITVSTNVGNTQWARVTSWRCHTNGAAFDAVCEFDFVGAGLQRDAFGHEVVIHRRQKELDAGKALPHQLADISVRDAGSGSVELEGDLTNGQPVVNEMRLRFNSHGHTSPVHVDLEDIALRNGALCYENKLVARVNTLTFRRTAGPPKMEVTLASVNRKDSGSGLWHDLVGEIKGAAANLLLPPLNITTNGQQAMLEFGEALARKAPAFTFPLADRLTNGPPITQ